MIGTIRMYGGQSAHIELLDSSEILDEEFCPFCLCLQNVTSIQRNQDSALSATVKLNISSYLSMDLLLDFLDIQDCEIFIAASTQLAVNFES